jgi:hypothetical protein
MLSRKWMMNLNIRQIYTGDFTFFERFWVLQLKVNTRKVQKDPKNNQKFN